MNKEKWFIFEYKFYGSIYFNILLGFSLFYIFLVPIYIIDTGDFTMLITIPFWFCWIPMIILDVEFGLLNLNNLDIKKD